MPWTFAPGVTLDCTPTAAQLRLLSSGAVLELPATAAPLLEQLALGTTEPPELAPLGEQAAAAGAWVVERADVLDPLVLAGLERLDRQFSWAGGTRLAGYDEVLAAHARRRRLLRSLGQYPALPETVARRAALAAGAGRVLVLGDDDLLSLALAARGHEVTATDADPYVLGLLAAEATRRGLRLVTRRWDFRQPVSADWCDRFDVVFTDPMSGPACLPLFVDRAIAALATGGRAFVSVSNAGARLFDVHRRDTRLVIEARLSDFNHYYTGQLTLSPYVSDLYETRKVEVTRPCTGAGDVFPGAGLYEEAHFGGRPASRFVIRDIDTTLSDLSHVQGLVHEAFRLAGLAADEEVYHWNEDYRAYVALLPGGRVLAIHLHLARRLVEMTMSPPDAQGERVLQAALLSVYGGAGAAHQISRLRTTAATHLP